MSPSGLVAWRRGISVGLRKPAAVFQCENRRYAGAAPAKLGGRSPKVDQCHSLPERCPARRHKEFAGPDGLKPRRVVLCKSFFAVMVKCRITVGDAWSLVEREPTQGNRFSSGSPFPAFTPQNLTAITDMAVSSPKY